MEAYLFPALLFGAVIMVGVVLFIALSPQESAVAARLSAYVAAGGHAPAGGGREAAKRPEKKSDPLLHRLALRIGDSVKSIFEGGGDETVHRLAMAGFSSPGHVASFHGTRTLLGVGAAAVVGLFLLLTGAPVSKMVLGAVIGLLLGMILPNFWLGMQIKKRREKIAAALPNMIDLLVVCVEAGLGLDAAMSRVGQELQLSAPELSRELLALGRELSAGQSHEQALARLAWRIGIDDVENLVSMLVQAERFGTSIAVSLRVFSDSFRTARRQRIEEAAAKTTIKLLFPLVFFIFPAIFVVLLGPALVGIMTGGLLR